MFLGLMGVVCKRTHRGGRGGDGFHQRKFRPRPLREERSGQDAVSLERIALHCERKTDEKKSRVVGLRGRGGEQKPALPLDREDK